MYDGHERFTRRLLYAWVYAVNRVGVVLSCGVLAPPMPGDRDSCQDSGFPSKEQRSRYRWLEWRKVTLSSFQVACTIVPTLENAVHLFVGWTVDSPVLEQLYKRKGSWGITGIRTFRRLRTFFISPTTLVF